MVLAGRLMGPVARVSAPEVIHSQVVSQPKQEGARNSYPSHPIRVSSQRDEEFLEEIPGVRLISGEVQQKREQGRRMQAAEVFQFGGVPVHEVCRFINDDGSRSFFRLSAMGSKEEELQEWLWMKTMGNDARVLGECV